MRWRLGKGVSARLCDRDVSLLGTCKTTTANQFCLFSVLASLSAEVYIKKAGEMAQELRALAALVEDLSLVPSTHFTVERFMPTRE